ncbi:MAG: methionine synthase [Actinomycetota bacterium]|jgi:5-methyltetrahydrofolate--homocysteine methyltransferase
MGSFLDTLRERVVVFDGATGTNLQARDLGPEDFGGAALEGCNEILAVTRPQVIADLHRSFFDVGVDAVETDTFGAFPVVLAEYGIAERTFELNEAAARIAKDVASGYSTPDRPRWVVGSIGPGTKLPSLGQIDFVTLRDGYEAQVAGLLAGGVDVLLIETVYDLLQAKAAVIAARRAMAKADRDLPLMVQVTMETTGRMLVGSEIGAALTALEALRPDVIGLNCATGPREMTEHLRHLSRHSRTFLSCLPNAGLPSIVDGATHYDLTPDELAAAHDRFTAELGVNIVGGCCGTTPEHLRRVVDTVGGRVPARREPIVEPGCSSIYTAVPFAQDTAYLTIGERTNANGSKKFREAMLAGDWNTCVQMAKEQVKEGAHVVDVCVDYVGRDGVADMHEIAGRFATAAPLPLVLDSTEPQVMEAGLQHIGGRAVLNSANLEDGQAPGSRCDRVFALAREYGAAVICLTIDEEGQARTADWKVRVAKRLHDLAVEQYGLEPSDLIFDALTFPLGAGQEDLRRDGIETIEAIRRIKAELPGVYTVLGVSNVSFGLKPAIRQVLNSVFLHECVEAGLDSAIVHSARILPMHRIDERARELCLDLIYDRRRPGYDPLQELIAAFSDIEAGAVEREDRSGWPVEERLKARIVDGDRDGLEADLDESLGGGRKALSIINDVLLEGMKVVGDLFASGEMQLPFVLQSAETMKTAVAYLEPHMEKADAGGKGRVVLGTVKGDVHDIGKNLVDIILTNNGYEVRNLGIKVPISEFIEAVEEFKADAVGMSGLLVKSTLIMRENLEELNSRGLEHIPVLLGGAALTRSYVERDLREVYKGRVFYGKDAFEGLRTMETLIEGKRTGQLDPDFGRAPGGRVLPPRKSQRGAEEVDASTIPARSAVAVDNPVFKPPFLGSRVAKGIPLDDIAAYLNETALFRNQWQFRPEAKPDGSMETDEEFKARIRPVLRAELAKAKENSSLIPAVAWGYFPVNADGNDLIVWTDDDRAEERMRFSFPRQRKEPWQSIADFFRPVSSGEADYAAFHVVTMSDVASKHAAELFTADKYQDYLYFHGLSVEMAEALAEYWHRRVREEWGFADEDGPTLTGLFKQQYRGSRYSWGYPACPDLDDQVKVADLLEIDRIGVTVSEGFQLHPEQSTSAIIVHHPEAKYFILG